MTKDDLEAQHNVSMQLRDHMSNSNDERTTCIPNVLTLDDRKEEKLNTKDNRHQIEKKSNTLETHKPMKLVFNQDL